MTRKYKAVGIFRRKRVERPKSPLGIALYDYDSILNTRFKKLIAYIKLQKPLKPQKLQAVMKKSFPKMENIVRDISKENLKVDYRSDKIRYKIIDMINGFKTFFEDAVGQELDYEKIDTGKLDSVLEQRDRIKKDMKEIESDYQ